MTDLIAFILKLPRDAQVTPEAAQMFLSTLLDLNRMQRLYKLLGKPRKALALEIVLKDQTISFQITIHAELVNFIEGQLQASYPLVTLERIEPFCVDSSFRIAHLVLESGNYYPLKTYPAFREVDPLASLLTVLSKAAPQDCAVLQFALGSAPASWQAQAEKYANEGTKNAIGTYSPRQDQPIIREKTNQPGLAVSIRVASNNSDLIEQVAHASNVFTRRDGNRLVLRKPLAFRKAKVMREFNARHLHHPQFMTTEELATLWHLPSEKIQIPLLVWGRTVLSEPPSNLPIYDREEERTGINFFARTTFRNRETIVGIKDADRRRHLWAIGKTGTGKSTLISNMAVDDMRKGKGIAVIDPHGDLCDALLDYIPKRRINDVIYFDPSDPNYPIALNPLEVPDPEQAELVVSGIISIFKKIFGYSWGPRLEYILRNALLTLTEIPESTLKEIPLLLTNSQFRDKVIGKLQDETLKSFWGDEFNPMPPNLQREAISPILNKVGQFVTSPLVRNVVGHARSSIDLEAVMNEGKILLANFSQGKIGEDNAQILGAMLITKFQLAAMKRVRMREDQRRDFFLYVDEFQNFATDSFVKILSEARKYHLSLMLANQYSAQIPSDVQKAILGNVGTLISFAGGAEDARLLHHEFAGVFSEHNLVNLANHQIALKLMADGQTQRPFQATTLALPTARNQNRATIMRVSRERWGRRRARTAIKQGSFGAQVSSHRTKNRGKMDAA